jgi:membrane-associated phospholipid phosphatase
MAIRTTGIALTIALSTCIGQLPSIAQEEDSRRFHHIGDTLVNYLKSPLEPKPLSWKAIVVPAGLIGYGTISVTSGWMNDVNLLGRRWASNNEDPDQKTSVDNFTQYVPAIAYYGLNIAGVRSKHNWMDASLMYAMSNGIANAIVMPVKRWSAERRPDSSDVLSFPSGHTATAFVSAEFLRQEYKDVSPWIGAAGYAAAITTGYLRMYNNKHWFSDVMAGAGIGILSTRASYWIYPKLKNLIVGKPAAGTTFVVPTYSNGQFGFCMVQRL